METIIRNTFVVLPGVNLCSIVLQKDAPVRRGLSHTCVALIDPVIQLAGLRIPNHVIREPSFINTQHVNQKMSSSGPHKSLLHDRKDLRCDLHPDPITTTKTRRLA
jgi:hypothetical protein